MTTPPWKKAVTGPRPSTATENSDWKKRGVAVRTTPWKTATASSVAVNTPA